MKRTRPLEILEKAGVLYELHEFDAEDYTAQEAAKKLGVAIETVYKTLVCKGLKGNPVMAVIPANKELNLKKLANFLGEKKCDLVSLAEMQRLTGYLKGGCSPLGSKKQLKVYIDQSAELLPKIYLSAGLRGLQILINPKQLADLAGASFIEL